MKIHSPVCLLGGQGNCAKLGLAKAVLPSMYALLDILIYVYIYIYIYIYIQISVKKPFRRRRSMPKSSSVTSMLFFRRRMYIRQRHHLNEQNRNEDCQLLKYD